MRSFALSGLALAVVLGACTETTPTDPDDTTPTTGALTVTAVTTGDDLDADGYTVAVGGTSQALGVNGSATFADLAVGAASVSLSGVAANCTVAESSPVAVTIVGDATATQTFTITCEAPPTDMVLVAASRAGSIYYVDETTGVETLSHQPMWRDTLDVLQPVGVISSMAYVPQTGAWWLGMGGTPSAAAGRPAFSSWIP